MTGRHLAIAFKNFLNHIIPLDPNHSTHEKLCVTEQSFSLGSPIAKCGLGDRELIGHNKTACDTTPYSLGIWQL